MECFKAEAAVSGAKNCAHPDNDLRDLFADQLHRLQDNRGPQGQFDDINPTLQQGLRRGHDIFSTE